MGVAELETAKSDWPAVATVVVAVEELLSEFGSGVADVMLAIAEIVVPEVALPETVKISGNDAPPPDTSEAMVQVRTVPAAEPAGSELHAQPEGGTKVVPTVVLAGTVSVNVRPEAVEGPRLLTVAVIVTLEPASVVGADAVFTT